MKSWLCFAINTIRSIRTVMWSTRRHQHLEIFAPCVQNWEEFLSALTYNLSALPVVVMLRIYGKRNKSVLLYKTNINLKEQNPDSSKSWQVSIRPIISACAYVAHSGPLYSNHYIQSYFYLTVQRTHPNSEYKRWKCSGLRKSMNSLGATRWLTLNWGYFARTHPKRRWKWIFVGSGVHCFWPVSLSR